MRTVTFLLIYVDLWFYYHFIGLPRSLLTRVHARSEGCPSHTRHDARRPPPYRTLVASTPTTHPPTTHRHQVQREIADLGVNCVEMPDTGYVGMMVNYNDEDVVMSMEQCCAMMLTKCMSIAEASAGAKVGGVGWSGVGWGGVSCLRTTVLAYSRV